MVRAQSQKDKRVGLWLKKIKTGGKKLNKFDKDIFRGGNPPHHDHTRTIIFPHSANCQTNNGE